MSPSASDSVSFSSRVTVRNGVSSPLPSVTLNRDHISQALSNSPDHGATLDLSHKSISDVGEDGAEELLSVGRDQDDKASSVVRIALAHNRLTTLPMAFALLSRLRYLVLKHNNFTVFPDVLMVMNSLEILDISRNKIKRLPSQPGSLINLRVFSIQRNKIHRLPPSFTQFQNLTLFKADQNPIEWPPKHIMELPPTTAEPDGNKEWIRSVQKWIENNATGTVERKLSDDSQGERSFMEIDGDTSMEESQPSTSGINETVSMHSRSFSLESDNSIYSDMAILHASHGPSPSRSPQPTRLRLDVLSARSRGGSASASPSRSPGSYLPTPDESISSVDEEASGSSRTQKNRPQLHGRNASSVTPSNFSRHRMYAKKSLPDLRPIHPYDNPHESAGPSRLAIHPPIPPPYRQDSDMGQGSLASLNRNRILTQDVQTASPVNVDGPAPPMDVERNSYFRRLSLLGSAPTSKAIPQQLLALVDAVRGILFAVSQVYQTLQHYTVQAIDERLSAVLLKVLDPASKYLPQLINALDRFDTMSRRNLPSPAVCRAVVENCRDNVTVFGKAVGVLALQLKVLATHDDVRYTRQMLLVLYGAMAEISSAWQTIATHAEAVKPLLREHRPPPVLAKKVFPQQSSASLRSIVSPGPDTPIPPPLVTPPMPPPLSSRSMLRSNSSNVVPGMGHTFGNDTSMTIVEGKIRLSRRHAGSFSSKDVELGKMMPSSIASPILSAGLAEPSSSVPTLRAIRRPTIPLGSSTFSSNTGSAVGGGVSPAYGPGMSYYATQQQLQQQQQQTPTFSMRWDAHSRQGSQSSLGATSSPNLGGLKVPNSAVSYAYPYSAGLDGGGGLSTSNTLVDREALEAMKVAVEAAPAIWEMMDEILVDAEEAQVKEGMVEALGKAKGVTERLKENIFLLESGDPAADRKGLREDAHIFVKTVIQLSNAIKTHGTSHPLSSTLRTNMVKLTNATQEFVILLHVSSFSPAPTPRPYSPMVGIAPHTPIVHTPIVGNGTGGGGGATTLADDGRIGMNGSGIGIGHDGRLGASLSRSRSAIPAFSSSMSNTAAATNSNNTTTTTTTTNLTTFPLASSTFSSGGGGLKALSYTRPHTAGGMMSTSGASSSGSMLSARNAGSNQTFKIPTPPRFGIMRARSGEEFSAVPG